MEMVVSITSEAASDAWGFVGVVNVGGHQAYRTLEAFATPDEAAGEAQQLVASVLGELLAGREWRQVHDQSGAAPRREDFAISAFRRQHNGTV